MDRPLRHFLLASLMLAPASVWADDSEDEEVDPDLAAAIAEEQDAQAEDAPPPAPAPGGGARMVSMNPSLSFILDLGVGAVFGDEAIEQGGHAIDATGFTVQGLELAASASVDPFFRFDLYFQLVGLHVEEVALTTLDLPWGFQVRAGYLIAPFGRENPRHLHAWSFVNPSLAHSRFLSPEHLSGLGAELSMLLPLPWYSLVLVEALDTASRAGFDFRSSAFGGVELTGTGETDGPEDFMYLGRLENAVDLAADWTLVLGVSFAWGQSPYSPDDYVNLYGGDLFLRWRPVSTGEGAMALNLTAEYFLRDTQIPEDSSRDHGWYAQAELQATRHWQVAVRFDNSDVLSGPSANPVAMAPWEWRGSAAVSYLPSHFSRIRLQYDAGHRFGHSGPYHAVFLQLEVVAGEHGAHRF